MNTDKFIVIAWPESQAFMEVDGFSENSILINDEPLINEYGSSAYLVRISWLDRLHEEKEEDHYPDGNIKPNTEDFGDKADRLYEQKRDNQ